MQKDGLKGNSRLSLAFNFGIKSNSNNVGEGVPIILVPSAFQTLLNMYNVKGFLEDGVYYAPDAKVKEMPKNPECITMHRKSGNDRIRFTIEVRDKSSALSLNELSCVVAVFVLGKEWKFKDSPFKDHAEIFNKSMFFLSSLIFMYFKLNSNAFEVHIIIEFLVVERFVVGSKMIKNLILNGKTM